MNLRARRKETFQAGNPFAAPPKDKNTVINIGHFFVRNERHAPIGLPPWAVSDTFRAVKGIFLS